MQKYKKNEKNKEKITKHPCARINKLEYKALWNPQGLLDAVMLCERAPEQIVRRDVVVIARLLDERKPRLADAVFIVGQKRLRNAELFRGLALGDPLFLPQQGKGAGKVSIHGNNLVK